MSTGFNIQPQLSNNSNQAGFFNLLNNSTTQNQTSLGTSNSQLNSSFNQGSSNPMFGNSNATSFSTPRSTNQSTGLSMSNNLSNSVNKPNSTNTFTFNNSSTSNNTNNSVFGNKPAGFPFGGTSSQNNFNIGNQNTLNQTNSNFAFSSTNATPANTLVNTNATQSIFGSSNNPAVNQPSLGSGSIFGSSSNISTPSPFGNPSTVSLNGNSNIFGNSQISSNFPSIGTSNMTSSMSNIQNSSSVSNSINLSAPQSNTTFGLGTSNQNSNFSFNNTQPNSASIASNVQGVLQNSPFNFSSSNAGQSAVNVTQAANQNTFNFGTPKTNNILGSNNFTSTPNVAAPVAISTPAFSMSTTGTSLISSTASNKTIASTPFLNLNASTPSTISQIGFGTSNTGLGGISSSKIQINNASPLASSSVSAKKGLGGSPISDSSKSVTSKDAAQKISVVKQVKDIDLLPELKETVESFKKFVTEQKKLREDIIKSNEVVSLITRVEEESQILRQSISDVANGLQKIQVQSNKLKSDICKEQSNIKIAQTSSETSLTMPLDRNESSSYFSNKVRELENRAGLYLQEIEVVESICNSANKSALTTRDLVEIIRKMDDEFIGLAAKLYMIHERVKTAKTEYSRRFKQANNYQNPFLAIEGRFGDTFESIKGLNTSTYRNSNTLLNSVVKISDTVGSSPFDNSCYINQTSSFSIPNTSSNIIQKPSIFGLNHNNNQITMSSTTSTTSPFSFSPANSTFTLNKPPTNLFLNDTVSNKKRR